MVHIYSKFINLLEEYPSNNKKTYHIGYYKNHRLFHYNRPIDICKSSALIVADQYGETIYNDLKNPMTTIGLPDQTMISGYKNDIFYIRFKGVSAEENSGHDSFYIGCNEEYNWLTCPLFDNYPINHLIDAECIFITDYNLRMECEKENAAKNIKFIGNVEWISIFNQICIPDVDIKPIFLSGGDGYNRFYFELNKNCITENNLTYWNEQQIIISEMHRYLPQTNLLYFKTISFKFNNQTIEYHKLNELSKLTSLINVMFKRDMDQDDTLHIRFLNEQGDYYGPIVTLEKIFSTSTKYEVQIIDQTDLSISLYHLNTILPIIGKVPLDDEMC